MISYKVARRAFLRGCGGSAALLLPILRSLEARAQGAPAPLRFLVIHHPLGAQQFGAGDATYGLSYPDAWRPSGPGGGVLTATTTTFTLPYESAPFAPLQSKLVMIDGLNIVPATRVPGGPDGIDTHEGGMVALMTGQPTLGRIGTQDHAAGGASIDQILLAKSPVLGGLASATKTPFGSLQLAADIRSDRDEIAPRVLSYLDPDLTQTALNLQRQPLYPETEPLNVFNRLFAVAAPGGNATQLLAQQKSVLDFMRADLARLRTLAPSSEKVRLDTQLDAIQQLESSIQVHLGLRSNQATCMTPPKPPLNSLLGALGKGANASGGSQNVPPGGSMLSGFDYYDPTNPMNHPHQVIGQTQLAMIRAAFACDLVRVATFMWSAGTNWVVFPGTFQGKTILGGPVSSPHHPFSHSADYQTVGWLSQINNYYSTQTCLALQAFDATTDIDGNTLLDNTLVAYVTEVSRAQDHNQQNMPFLTFGGKNTRVKGGTFLKVTDGSLPSRDGKMTNRPTNDAWLALAPVFGVNMTSLGAPKQFTGPLPGIVS